MRNKYFLEEIEESNNNFSLITDYDGSDEHAFTADVKSGAELPVLPLRNMVLFPGVFLPITVGRKMTLRLVHEAEKKNLDIAVVCQKKAETEDPKFEDLHDIGTVARIVRVLEPNNHRHLARNEPVETFGTDRAVPLPEGKGGRERRTDAGQRRQRVPGIGRSLQRSHLALYPVVRHHAPGVSFRH